MKEFRIIKSQHEPFFKIHKTAPKTVITAFVVDEFLVFKDCVEEASGLTYEIEEKISIQNLGEMREYL